MASLQRNAGQMCASTCMCNHLQGSEQTVEKARKVEVCPDFTLVPITVQRQPSKLKVQTASLCSFKKSKGQSNVK